MEVKLTQEERDALLAATPEEYRGRVRAVEGAVINPEGDLEVLVGQKVGRPVIRDVATMRLVKGSGRFPRANDPAATGRDTAFKQTKTYREALENVYTLLGDTAGHTFEQLVEMFHQAVDGSPQMVDCPHPELHSEKEDGPRKHLVAFKKDPNAIFKMIELLAGKARETVDVSATVLNLHKLLDERQEVPVLRSGLTTREVETRRAELLEQGVIEEGWFRELPEGEDADG